MSDIAQTERIEFSGRLEQALRAANYDGDSPTKLMREFNARFSGEPISVHAARKWLVGEAIPTQDKIRVLADWLGVTAEWLRFGAGARESGTTNAPIASPMVNLIADIQRLSDRDQALIREFVRSIVRVNANGARRA